MHLSIQFSDDDAIHLIGAAVGRRGDHLAAVVSSRLSRREQVLALLELITDEEHAAIRWAPIVAVRDLHVPSQRSPLLLRSA